MNQVTNGLSRYLDIELLLDEADHLREGCRSLLIKLMKQVSLHLIGKLAWVFLVCLDKIWLLGFNSLDLPARHFESFHGFRGLHSITNNIFVDQLMDLRLNNCVWISILVGKLIVFVGLFFI